MVQYIVCLCGVISCSTGTPTKSPKTKRLNTERPNAKRPSCKTSQIQNIPSLRKSQASKRPKSKMSLLKMYQVSERPKSQNVPASNFKDALD